MVIALPPLVLLTAFLLVYGLHYNAHRFVQGLVDAIKRIVPIVNPIAAIIGWPLAKIGQALLAPLNDFVTGTDAHVGLSFHQLARLVRRTYAEVAALSQTTALLAKALTGAATSRDLGTLWHALTVRAQAIAHQLDVLRANVKTTAVGLAHRIDGAVLPRVRGLEHELDHVIDPEIAGLRKRTRTLEEEALRTFRWFKVHKWLATEAAFAGAVALALSRLGAGWIRCSSARSFFKNRGCGVWHLFDDLLGLLADAIVLANICDVLPFIEDAFGAIEGPLVSFLTEIPLGDCEKPPKKWAALDVQPATLPPPQTLGTLAG